MHNAQIVFLTSDTDCDGTSYGATRIPVPAHLRTEDEIMAYARSYDASANGIFGVRTDEVYRVMTLRDFLSEFGHTFTYDGERDQFCGAWTTERNPYDGTLERRAGLNYQSIGANWNPWVYDDTIGIPALDTRYDY